MNELIFFFNKVIVAGSVIGSIYAMGAIGITLVFAILRFAHFAHADLMTLGAFFSYILVVAFPELGGLVGLPSGFVVLPVAMILTAVVAIGLDNAFYKPLRDKNVKPVVIVIASVGVTLMIQGLIRLFAGTTSRNFFTIDGVADKDIFRIKLPFDIASRKIFITEPQILLFVFLAITVALLHYFSHPHPPW